MAGFTVSLAAVYDSPLGGCVSMTVCITASCGASVPLRISISLFSKLGKDNLGVNNAVDVS